MLSIVFGLIAICLGIWGLVSYWWYVVEMVIAMFPLFLIFSGIIAVMAGIKNTGLKMNLMDWSNQKEGQKQKGAKKDT